MRVAPVRTGPLYTDLKAKADELLPQLDAVQGAERDAVASALQEYLPSDDGKAARTLLAVLTSRQATAATPRQGGSTGSGYEHPMRAARLRFGLLMAVWVTIPSFFGPKAEGTKYHYSHDQDRCSFFVSHSWCVILGFALPHSCADACPLRAASFGTGATMGGARPTSCASSSFCKTSSAARR